MAAPPKYSRAVPIVTVSRMNSLNWDMKELRSVLLADAIRDLAIVVVSIVGAYRTGKSFLMNFFLRYVQSGCKYVWLEERDVPMKGFHWSRKSELDTTGIMAWNEAFQVTTPSGEKVVVLFIDTQGMFDGRLSTTESANLFAISTLLSSVQVYNVQKNIQADQLQHLALLSNYAQLAEKGASGTPFQKLLFLVRDWNFPLDEPYGEQGGRHILERWLHNSEGKAPDTQDIQKQIISCFQTIDCFLMPHPGLQAIRKKEFSGSIAEIDEDFVLQVGQLAHFLLSPENLVVKKRNGRTVTCKDMVYLLQKLKIQFSGCILPTMESLVEANVERQLEIGMEKALELYETRMREHLNAWNDCLEKEDLVRIHKASLSTALALFYSSPNFRRTELTEVYGEQLAKEMELQFKEYSQLNDMRIFMEEMKRNTGIMSVNAALDRALAPLRNHKSRASTFPGDTALGIAPRGSGAVPNAAVKPFIL